MTNSNLNRHKAGPSLTDEEEHRSEEKKEGEWRCLLPVETEGKIWE